MNGCKVGFKDKFIKYVFRFFEPFRPRFCQNLLWVIIKAKIDAEFEAVEKKCRKRSPKKIIDRKLLQTVIKVKNSIFCSFFADNFLCMSILHLLQRIRNQHQIPRFLKPILHL
jgi:hypothetical protein